MTIILVFVAIVLALAGCEPVVNSGGSIDSDIACFSAKAVVAATKNAPPTPPQPDGICENCNGKGKVGDGTVMVTCPVCKGTGKK